MRLVIRAGISQDLRKPKVFVRTTWAKTRGVFEFQLRSITPCYSTASMAVKRGPTTPAGVAYQIADW